jgi:hypothetical protein
MTHKFPLIPIEDGFVLVNTDEAPKDYHKPATVRQTSSGWMWSASYFGTIFCPTIFAHTGIPSLKDSGLPLITIPDKIDGLSQQSFAIMGYCSGVTKQEELHYKLGYKEGYKESGGFSEEDMREALRVGVNIGMQNVNKPRFENDFNFDQEKAIQECDDYLQSLKKHPVAVVVEMSHDIREINSLYPQPKVVDGYIKIVEVIYE